MMIGTRRGVCADELCGQSGAGQCWALTVCEVLACWIAELVQVVGPLALGD